MKLDDVAAQAELSKGTIITAMKAYTAGGWSAVAVGKRGRGTGDGRTLTAEQEAAIRRPIRDRTPDEMKIPFVLWYGMVLGELILQQAGLKMPVRTVGHYLRRWGFTPQKSINKAYEQRPAEVQAWLKEEFPSIVDRVKAEGAEIHWGDETGLRSDDVRGRGYSPRGQAPVVRVYNKCENVSLISTVTNPSKVRWMVFDGALNAKILIGFFKRLIKDAHRKMFLILDNLRVHHATIVGEWLDENTARIEVFYPLSYSPELNPDECLNADLKQPLTTKAPLRAKAQLKKATISHLRKL